MEAVQDANADVLGKRGELDAALEALRSLTRRCLSIAKNKFRNTPAKLEVLDLLKVEAGSRSGKLQEALEWESAWEEVDAAWVPLTGVNLASFKTQRLAAGALLETFTCVQATAKGEGTRLTQLKDQLSEDCRAWYEAATNVFLEGTPEGDLIRSTVPTTYAAPSNPPAALEINTTTPQGMTSPQSTSSPSRTTVKVQPTGLPSMCPCPAVCECLPSLAHKAPAWSRNGGVLYTVGPLASGKKARIQLKVVPTATGTVATASLATTAIGVGLTNIGTNSTGTLAAISVQPPALTHTRGSNFVELKWHSDADLLSVECSTRLGANVTWNGVGNAVTREGSQRKLRLPFDSSATFYRLRSQWPGRDTGGTSDLPMARGCY